METTAHIAQTIAQAGLLVLLGPLVTGFIQKIKARLQCRQGASMWQPYRDLLKLLRKGTVQSDTASPFFRAIPVLVLAATVTTTAMLPVLWAGAGPAAVAPRRCDLALGSAGPGALSVRHRSARRWRGVRRHGGVARDDRRPAGRAGPDDGGVLGLGGRRDHRSRRAWPLGVERFPRCPGKRRICSLCSPCWCWPWPRPGRIPVDNPDTHLELTMLHEGMLLEHSGPGLACIVLATHTKQLVILTLVAALFFPLGLAPGFVPGTSPSRWRPSVPRCWPWRYFWPWSNRPTRSCAFSACRNSLGWAWCAPFWRWR
jgi:hypothetical protein